MLALITIIHIMFLVIINDLGDQMMIKFNDKLITYNKKFRLFITTKLPNPHYTPEISTKTTLCNFAIKEQGN